MQGFWTKILNTNIFFYAGALIVLMYLIFSLNNSFDKLNKLSSIKSNIENKNKNFIKEIEKLKEEINYIKNNPSYYLKIAKKEYFFTKPNEFLYIIISKEGINTQTSQEKKRNTNGKCGGIEK